MKKRKFFDNDIFCNFSKVCTLFYREEGKTIGFVDGVIVSDVAYIWRLSCKIIQGEGNVSLSGRGGVVAGGLEREFIRALNKANAILGRCGSAWKFDPYVDLFLREVASSGRGMHFSYDKVLRCINNIREEGNSLDFKVKINSFGRSPNKNYKSLMGYFEGLFKKHNEAFVVRLSLFYSKGIGSLESGRGYEKVACDRDSFLSKGLSGFSNKLLGYVWKFEGDSIRGYRLHFVLFFDRGVSENGSVGVMLGRYWENSITAGEGRFFCLNGLNGRVFSYKGSVGPTEVQEMAVYLSLVDAYARAVLPKGARRLGRGQA